MGSVTNYAILRVAKLRNAAAIRGAVGHNARTRPTPNADPNRRNKVWEDAAMGPDGRALDPHAVVLDRIGRAGAKIRENSVLAVEVLCTASPGYFRPGREDMAGTWDRDRMIAWAKATRRFLLAKFGDRMVDCRLHLDEATPHIQAIVVPLTDDGRLSARDTFNPFTLQAMQTEYANELAPLGLERGIEGSKAKHQRVQRFYGAAAKAAPPAVEVEQPPEVPTPPVFGRKEWAEAQTKKGKQWAKGQTKKARAITAQQADKAASAEIERTARKGLEATAKHLSAKVQRTQAERDQLREQLKETAARLRDVPVIDVLRRLGLDPDPADPKNQFVMPGHRVSVDTKNRQRFFDHGQNKGGGGAIDAAMIVGQMEYREAVAWLADHFGDGAAAAAVRADADRLVTQAKADPRPPFKLPERSQDPGLVARVRDYLVRTRALAADLVAALFERNQVFADKRGNAVFVCADARGQPTGAELKGTVPGKPFTGMAAGSRRNEGAFVLRRGTGNGAVVLVEAAIDAASYWQLHDGDFSVISTAGARPDIPWPWLREKAASGRLICAYDADATGDAMAAKLAETYPGLIRQRPEHGKDWNDCLKGLRQALAKGLEALERPQDPPAPPPAPEPPTTALEGPGSP